MALHGRELNPPLSLPKLSIHIPVLNFLIQKSEYFHKGFRMNMTFSFFLLCLNCIHTTISRQKMPLATYMKVLRKQN